MNPSKLPKDTRRLEWLLIALAVTLGLLSLCGCAPTQPIRYGPAYRVNDRTVCREAYYSDRIETQCVGYIK